MRQEFRLFLIGSPFFFGAAIVYGVWSHGEPVGSVALALTGALVAMVGVYLAVTAQRIDDRPEDDPFAEVEDGAGDLGVFAPWSWWPLAVGLSAATVFLGLATGLWLSLIGILVSVVSLIGWVFEYSRGVHAH